MTIGRKLWIACLLSTALAGQLLLGSEAEAQDPTKWAETMRVFATEDASSPSPANAIVFTGSSSIVYWKTVHADIAPLTVIHRGFGGSTMADAVYWLDAIVLKYRPRAVVLYEGDNDIGKYGMTAEEVLEDFKTFIARLHAGLPEARLFFLAIKPSLLRWSMWPEMRRANELIRALCESDPRLHFIDVASPMLNGDERPQPDLFEADGLHLNATGYELWTSVARPILLKHEERFEVAVESTGQVERVCAEAVPCVLPRW